MRILKNEVFLNFFMLLLFGYLIFHPILFFYFLMRGLEISKFQRYFTFVLTFIIGLFVMHKGVEYLWIVGPFVGYFAFVIGTYIEEGIRHYKNKKK